MDISVKGVKELKELNEAKEGMNKKISVSLIGSHGTYESSGGTKLQDVSKGGH